MHADTLAATYARALLELAHEQSELERVRGDVVGLIKILETEKDLRTFVESPRIAKSEKTAVLERALRGKVSDHFLNFLLVVARKGRETFLVDMLHEFGVLYDKLTGLVRAHLTTAYGLSPAEVGPLQERLARSLGKTVELDTDVDEEILGGFVIRFDGMVADGSLRKELEAIGASMRSASLGSQLIHED